MTLSYIDFTRMIDKKEKFQKSFFVKNSKLFLINYHCFLRAMNLWSEFHNLDATRNVLC